MGGKLLCHPYDNRLEEWIITSEKTKMYIVRSLSMVNWLCNNGHQILKVEDSEKDSRLKVFLFEDTAALHSTMARFPKGVWLYWQTASKNGFRILLKMIIRNGRMNLLF